MYRITRTSTICLTTAVALILLTSTTLTASVYATRHHSHRNIEDMPTNFGGYQGYGPQLAGQGYGNGNPVSDQTNGNGNNPVGNQVNAPPISDQAYGNGNNPVGKEQIQTHAPTIPYKSPSSNDMLMSLANITQPRCCF